ncbi:MAG: hypothetical protein SFX72_22045 [Isosphaeraceae bacterium]|nr:hypothetical protein [Isosphaeraceae bacterium]
MSSGATQGPDSEQSSPSFDWDRFRARFDGDLDLIREIVDLFEPEFRIQIIELRSAARMRNGTELERVGHSLRGAVSNFDETCCCDLIRVVEESGRLRSFDGVLDSIERAERAIEEMLREVRHRLATTSSDSGY